MCVPSVLLCEAIRHLSLFLAVSVQGTDQPGEGQRERSHGPGGEQERSEHPLRGNAASSGAGS